jgi:hypothetical protein
MIGRPVSWTPGLRIASQNLEGTWALPPSRYGLTLRLTEGLDTASRARRCCLADGHRTAERAAGGTDDSSYA